MAFLNEEDRHNVDFGSRAAPCMAIGFYESTPDMIFRSRFASSLNQPVRFIACTNCRLAESNEPQCG